MPVFAETSNVSGAFDAEALATISRFPMFVAEKAYDCEDDQDGSSAALLDPFTHGAIQK